MYGVKIILRILWIIYILLYLQACSGIKVSQDYEQGYDFSGLKIFSWKANKNKEYGLKNNDLVDNRIRNAIEKNLSAKQFTLIGSQNKPDFYISYHVTIKQKVSSSGVSSGFAVGRSSYGRHGSIGISSGSDVRVYNQGTLLIDITSSKTNKLIWRGISTQSVSDHLKPGESAEIINETVEKILKQFPPKK